MTISNFAGAPSETDVKLAVDVAAMLGAKPGELKDDLETKSILAALTTVISRLRHKLDNRMGKCAIYS